MTRVCSGSTEAAALGRSLISWPDDEQISIFFKNSAIKEISSHTHVRLESVKRKRAFEPLPLCVACIETKKFCHKGQTFNILFNILWQTQIKYEKIVGGRET